MTKTKQNREFGNRGNARLERPIPGSIVADPLPATSGLLPTAETALLETLGIATQALARACAQAALLPHATAVGAAQTPAADGGVVRTIEPQRRNLIVGGGAGGERLAVPCPETDKGQTVFVYCAGCNGLRMLALDRADGLSGDRSPTPTPIFKLGTSSGSARTRLLELSAIGYAARSEPNGQDESGFEDWLLARIVARPSSDRAILVHGGVIEVRLPATLSPSAFEARLREALEPLLIEHHADGGGGGDRIPPRWTRPRRPGGLSSRATELYRVRPREDGDHCQSAANLDPRSASNFDPSLAVCTGASVALAPA